MPDRKIPDLFTVYYMNDEKVFETTMLLGNVIVTGSSSETSSSVGGDGAVGAEGGFKLPIFSKLGVDIQGELHGEKQKKVVDTLAYVNTKSRMLSQIIRRCKTINMKTKSAKDKLTEGDLVYIDGLSLELINEEEIRSIMMLTNGILDGFTIPESGNLDLGHMVQSFLHNGAAFKLIGKYGHDKKPLYMKIPLDGKDMFESKYTIDDLLIGRVGVVGICKGLLTPDKLKSPLDYFQNSKTASHITANVIECGEEEASTGCVDEEDGEKGIYIDVFAVIQSIALNDGGGK
ncbi:hypothetical protein [Raoultibacter massiliensis]|uniref:Uncharacterized protein n=1 Tax=Raoultibacter massiliensis TaxID=1852371 RepID=A0ABV1JF42_9ACTN|nr:hypothetical protein [Candidatus Aphodovivens avicola]